MDLTEDISAQAARLIPTVADSNKEQRVVSVTLRHGAEPREFVASDLP